MLSPVTAKVWWGEIGGCCEAGKTATSSNLAQSRAVASFSLAPSPFQLPAKRAASSPAPVQDTMPGQLPKPPRLEWGQRKKRSPLSDTLGYLNPSLPQSPAQFLINNVLPPCCAMFVHSACKRVSLKWRTYTYQVQIFTRFTEKKALHSIFLCLLYNVV